ncbi:MAG: PIN domain-containing protein [Leptolyngbyaceae bacterium]|nr:PIN domain-containing protein [Leptolyngbyaceae bacterium]
MTVLTERRPMSSEKVFVDTNLFLRYLTNDVPEQADHVEDLLQRAAKGELVLVTSAMVIAEIVWTLASFYKLSREQIRDNLLAILNTPGLEVAEADLLLQAISDYVAKNVDFIDAYNVAWMMQQELKIAYSFDRKHFSRFESITTRIPGLST